MGKQTSKHTIAIVGMGKGKKGTSVRAICRSTGNDITSDITYMTLSKAYKAGMWLSNETGKWRQIPAESDLVGSKAQSQEKTSKNEENTPILAFLQTCVSKRPKELFCADLTWKHLCRSVMRGKNIMLTGPTGTGKSQTAFAVAKALDRELFYINLGATQDPRGALIGNTHFSKDTGTYFSESAFVKAIQVPNQVILLDELSRAHPEAWNILMTVLDPKQRYLRLDEAANTPTIKVAEGVSFIATANVGAEYTAVRQLDRALEDRFTIVEIPFLNVVEEQALLQLNHPTIDKKLCTALAEIAAATRAEIKSDNSRIGTPISTRVLLEMAEMTVDGFTLEECAEVGIYPMYSQDGGMQSERTFVKQLVQKYCTDGTSEDLSGANNITDDNSPF